MNEPRELKFRPKPTIIADGERSQEAIVNTESNTSVVDTITVKEVKEFIKEQGNESDAKFAGLSSNNTFTGRNTFNGDVAISGNLNVQGEGKGKISGNEIVEVMSGYSASTLTAENAGYTKEFVYVGVCKNGNKLTFVCAFNLTKSGQVEGNNPYICEFRIPSSIGSKLYPTSIGNHDYLEVKANTLNADTNPSNSKSVNVVLQKVSNTIIYIRLFTKGDMVANTKYYCRAEFTCLLNDSLITQ